MYLASILVLIVVTAILLLSYAHIFGHTVRVGKVRPFYLTNIQYTGAKSGIKITSSRVEIHFHLPRPSNPRWATFTAHDYEFRNPHYHFSILQVHATLWVLPLLFRFTAGPWVTVKLDDFCIRIFSSKATPTWIEDLRANLLSTILNGETLRCDSFETNLSFVNTIELLSGAVNGKHENNASRDELRITASSEQWHILNFRSRMYTFGKLDAQLRKNCADDIASFVLIAKESRWTKVPRLKQEQTFASPHWTW